ncbi:MAG: hypothetical protein U9O96_06670 [Candidatus Thermoplasmatota archaeon]|nr:hypothetical protein [Candidatus Thermoplasmatota archaeon]
MKRKYKTIGVLVVVGVFVIPMMPVKAWTPPDDARDIVVTECKGIRDLPGELDHTAIYAGSNEILEADPRFEKWKPWERWLYPTNHRRLHQKSYSGNENYGRAERDELDELFNPKYYSIQIYLRVPDAYSVLPDIVDFAQDKADRKWVVGGIPNKSRPFDYISFWSEYTKQVDNPNDPNSLGFGYYCSELTWAAYKSKDFNLDPNGNEVRPQDIYDSDITEEYRRYTT